MTRKIRAVIVDDEALARKNLRLLLTEYCEFVEVIGEGQNIDSAFIAISELKPELVFLDIRMPSGTEGFDLLRKFEVKDFQVIFVTAFKEYAIDAFRASALNYLLKPIDVDELVAASKTAFQNRIRFEEQPKSKSNYNHALERISDLFDPQKSRKIAVSHARGIKLLDTETISFVEAKGSYTIFHFKAGGSLMDSKTLKSAEKKLAKEGFFRVHKSYLVNLNYVLEYINSEGHFVLLEDGSKLPIARNRLKNFIDTIKR